MPRRPFCGSNLHFNGKFTLDIQIGQCYAKNMTKISGNIILKKLEQIEELQKEMLKDWSLVEDLILETTAKQLKKDIRLGRKAYRSGKSTPYRKLRTSLGLA